MFGNGPGGLLIAVTSPRGALVLDCVSFLGSALVVRVATRARPPLRGEADGAARSNVLQDSLAGMSAVLAHRRLRRVLLLGWLVPTCAVAPEALAAPYVADLGLSAGAVGWWLAAIPAGTIVGELVAIWFVSPAWRVRLISVFAAATFVPLLAFAGQPGLAVAIPLLIASGLCSVWVLGQDALILEVTPEHLLGRVFSVNTAGLISLQGLGFAAAGALAEFVPPHVAIVIAGVAGLAVVATLAPGIRGPGSARQGDLGSRATLTHGPRRPEPPPSCSSAAPTSCSHSSLRSSCPRRRLRIRPSRSPATATATASAWGSTAPRAMRCRAGRTSRSWPTTTRARRSGRAASRRCGCCSRRS